MNPPGTPPAVPKPNLFKVLLAALLAIILPIGLVLVGIIVVVIGGCVWVLQPLDAKGPKETAGAYAQEFGPVPAGVTDIQSRVAGIRDWMGAWLTFNADRPVVEAILARGFKPIPYGEFASETGGANIPPWWKPAKGLVCYSIDDWVKGRGSSRAYLAVDPTSRQVYFYHTITD